MARTRILYRLTVGKPLVIDTNLFVPFENGSLSPIDLEKFYNVNDPEGYQLDNHQLKFSIQMSSLTQKTNTGKFNIANLDDDFVNYLVTNRNNNLAFLFEAGDDDQGIREVFKGTVTSVRDDFSSETRMTEIVVTDAGVNTKNAFTVKSFARNTPYQTVIESLVADLKLPVESIPTLPGPLPIPAPTSYTGPTVKLLTEELNRLGYTFSIQNGNVSILGKNQRKAFQASLITAETGLIGKIRKFSEDTKSSVNQPSQKSEGVSFVCLLDAALKPDETVYLKDDNIDGPYKLIDVDFEGDFEAGQWLCNCRAVVAEDVTVA